MLAHGYWTRGWSVLALPPGQKAPTSSWKMRQTQRLNPFAIAMWWTQRPDANLGIVTGRVSGLVVVDLDHAWADVFVAEPTVPQIKIGQPATVFTDAGGNGLPGTVAYISPKAEFTPRNVQTAEERSKLVYRVRINVDNKEGVLKQGMPVEAEIPLGNAGTSTPAP